MTFEKANVTRIEVEEEDIITASGCTTNANQYMDNCNGKPHSVCGAPNSKGNGGGCPKAQKKN